jgi:hypothetical protein
MVCDDRPGSVIGHDDHGHVLGQLIHQLRQMPVDAFVHLQDGVVIGLAGVRHEMPGAVLDGVGLHLHPHVEIQGLPIDGAPQQLEAFVNPLQRLFEILGVRFAHGADGDEMNVVDLGFELGRVGVGRIQARRIQARDEEAVHLLGREGHGHIDHAHLAARVGKHPPQAAARTQGGVGQLLLVRAGNAAGEVEDAVLARIQAGEEGCPGHRCEELDGRSQAAGCAVRLNAGQSGQMPLVDPGLQQGPGHAVQTNDPDALGGRGIVIGHEGFSERCMDNKRLIGLGVGYWVFRWRSITNRQHPISGIKC